MGPVLPIVKLGVAAVAAVPVKKVVDEIVRHNVAQPDSKMIKAGGYIIGMMVAAPLSNTVDVVVDNAIDTYNKIRNRETTPEIPPADNAEVEK